ncbi:MAG: hypothetical protein M3137_10665, partial [Actinomycetota bacterium]|nr:hypothetical protein [Actinomycetota bacterium]
MEMALCPISAEDRIRRALHVAVEGVEASPRLWEDIEGSRMRLRRSRRPHVGIAAAIAVVVAAAALVLAGRDTADQQVRVTSPGNGLVRPRALAVAADGSLLIADQGRNQILRRTAGGELVPLAGTGRAGFSGDGGPGAQAELDQPAGLAVAGDGTVYVADTANNRIRRIGTDGVITTVAGSGHGGFSGDGGPATAADLTGPQAVALGPDGTLYLTDSGRVRRIGSDGTITTTVGGSGPLVVDGGPVSFVPNAIAMVGSGDLYVASASPKELLRVTPDGTVSGVGGVSVAPAGLAATPDGGVVIANQGNFSVDYGHLGVGPGATSKLMAMATFTKGSIPGVAGTFRPSGVAVGGDGRIFAATDGANGGATAPAVIEILPDGTVHLVPTTACVPASSGCGAPAISQNPSPPGAGAHLGDGFCEPDLANAGFQISALPPGVAASHAKEAAIEKARAYAGTESGRYDAYVASVRSPAAPTVGVGDSGTGRPTWVVEASDVALPQRSTDPLLRGGPTNPGPYRMVVFVDDATLTTAGAWAACPPMPAPQPAGSATGQDSPPASAIPPPAGPAARAGRLCQPADLAASWDGPSALAGAFLYSVILTNTSATDCDLGVAPSVIAVGDGGAAPVAGLPGPTPLDRPADMIHT